MTPKEKAKDLIWKFNDNVQWDLKEVSFNGHTSEVVGYNLSFETKKYALIAVNEILNLTSIRESWFNVKGKYEERFVLDQYWVEVKKEIEAL